jgi:hypothetical protein
MSGHDQGAPGAPPEGRAAMTIGSCAGAKFTDKESSFSLSVPWLHVGRRQVPQHVLYFRNHLRVSGVLSAVLQARAFGNLMV